MSCWNWNRNTVAKEEARERENAEEKEEPTRKLTGKGLAEAFTDLTKPPKKLKNMDPNAERSNIHGTLSTYKEVYDEKQKTKKQHHGHISEKTDTSRRA